MAGGWRLGAHFHSPIYVHSHVRTFEENILQQETFLRSLDYLNDAMKNRIEIIIKTFADEIKRYEQDGINIKALFDDFERFRKESETFISFKKSFSRLQVQYEKKPILWPQENGKEVEDPNVLEFLKANGFNFELQQIYVEDLTVLEMMNRRLSYIMSISEKELKKKDINGDPIKKITNLKQFKKGKAFDGINTATKDVQEVRLSELGITKDKKTAVNKRNAQNLLKALRVYSKEHINQAIANIEAGRKEFMKLIEDSTDKLASLKPYVGNATKNIEIIKNLGKTPESISLDKLFTIQSFRDNFKSSLMIVYSLLALIWENIAINILRQMMLNGLATEATDTELIITTKQQQDTNTSDVLIRRLSSETRQVLQSRVPFGISIKSNLKNSFYGEKSFKNVNASLVGGEENIRSILYFLVNYETLKSFNVDKYISTPSTSNEIPTAEILNASVDTKTLSNIYEKITYLMVSNTLLLGLINSAFAHINKQEELFDLDKIIGFPILLLYPNTIVYTHELLGRIKDYSFGAYGKTFSLRNKQLKADGPGIWLAKRQIIEEMIAANNFQGGYPYIKEKLGPILNFYDKDIPLTVHFNLTMPTVGKGAQ